MRASREQMAEHRGRILDEASRLIRAKGFETVSVAEAMKAADLTHGGFYGHFSSKDDLIAQSIAHALAKVAGGGDDILAYLDAYLSPRQRDNAAHRCPTAGLADIRHQTVAARLAMSSGLKSQIDRTSAELPGDHPADRRRIAIGSWAAIVGAVILIPSNRRPCVFERGSGTNTQVDRRADRPIIRDDVRM
ncbi:TetR/AcrR family transcriptional regulator [Novosphingobium sp. G106]|nr:TetR/AcrR family transcriptional regulator [Novosphingobium sp. G106]